MKTDKVAVTQSNKFALYLSGLALASAGVYDIVASFSGEGYIGVPIFLSILAIVINFDQIKDTIKKDGLGAKWAWIPLLIIWLSAAGQLDINTIAYVTWFVAVYFLGRSLNKKVFDIIPYAAIVVSIWLIGSRLTLYFTGLHLSEVDSPAWYLWSIKNDMAFLVLMGMIFAHGKKISTWMWLLGVPAILIGCSQEGLVILAVLWVVWFVQSRHKLALVVLLGAFVAVVGLTGYGYLYDLNIDRFSSLDRFLHVRVGAVENLFSTRNWIWGTGWDFNFTGKAIHNTILDMASNIGIIAGLAWLFAMIAGLFKTKYKWAFLILIWWGIIDHSLWTELAIWSPMILGILTQKEKRNVTIDY